MSTQAGFSVAANVKAEATRRGLVQSDLATALGVSRAAMSRRLTGEMEFSVSELITLADFLGVDTRQLLDSSQTIERGEVSA